jgi:hypothetical protein
LTQTDAATEADDWYLTASDIEALKLNGDWAILSTRVAAE